MREAVTRNQRSLQVSSFLFFCFNVVPWKLVLIGLFASVLAKEAGDDEDMAEMIGSEINSLSKEIEDLEKQLKV